MRDVMGFWIFMLCTVLLVPLIMLFFGLYFKNKSPKEINSLFGYRTTMSMKNKDTWEFAHHYCGRLWLVLGMIMLPLSVIPMLFFINQDIDVVGIAGGIIEGIQVVILLISIFPTEKALKKTFDENGNRRIS